MPRPAGQLVLEEVAEPSKLPVHRLVMLLVSECFRRIEPEDLRHVESQVVEIFLQIGAVVGVDRRVRLDKQNLPPRRVLEQLLADDMRLVLLRRDGMDHDIAVGEHGAQDVEVKLAPGTVVGLLGVWVRAVDQNHLLEERHLEAMDLDGILIETQERGIDIRVAGDHGPPRHGPVFLAGPADPPAQQGIEERALAGARAPQKADDESPVKIDLGNAQARVEPGDQGLRLGEWRPGRGSARPVEQSGVQSVEAGQQVFALPVGGGESISQGILSPASFQVAVGTSVTGRSATSGSGSSDAASSRESSPARRNAVLKSSPSPSAASRPMRSRCRPRTQS